MLDARSYPLNHEKTECMYDADGNLCPWAEWRGFINSRNGGDTYVTEINGVSYRHYACEVNNNLPPCGRVRRTNGIDCTTEFYD